MLELEGVGVVLEHLPPEHGALAGIHLDMIRLRETPALFIHRKMDGNQRVRNSRREQRARRELGKAGVNLQVGDVGGGEYAGDGGGLHDHVGAVGLREGLVAVVEARAERGGEGGERQRGGDLGVDGVGQAAGALEAGPPGLPPVAGAGRRVHGRRADRRAGETLDRFRTGETLSEQGTWRVLGGKGDLWSCFS